MHDDAAHPVGDQPACCHVQHFMQCTSRKPNDGVSPPPGTTRVDATNGVLLAHEEFSGGETRGRYEARASDSGKCDGFYHDQISIMGFPAEVVVRRFIK